MIKYFQTLCALVAFAILTAFTTPPPAITGTYGVSDSDPSAIRLTLNADHTFAYRDLSNPDKRIEVSGTWVLKHSKVTLKSAQNGVKFHKVWKIESDGNAAKSHKGMCFYRLCRIAE